MSEMCHRLAEAIEEAEGEGMTMENIARCALEAMKKPTLDMVRAGREAREAASVKIPEGEDINRAMTMLCFTEYQAMIDEALK